MDTRTTTVAAGGPSARWIGGRAMSLVVGAALGLGLAGCTAGGDASGAEEAAEGGVRVVATTGVLGDVVGEVLGDAGTVEVLMAPGQDPHTFQLSARQAADLEAVDLVVANGLGLEAGIDEALDQVAATGVPVVEVGPELDPLAAGEDDHPGHGGDDEPADDDEGEDEHGDEHGALDPHVWLDADRMSRAPAVVAAALDEVGPGPWEANAERLAEELATLDREVAATIDEVPERCRVVASDHDVLHYFGDRYGLEIPVTVIPGTSTDVDPSAADVAAGIEVIEESGIAALVVEDSLSTRLADAVASDAVDVEVLELPLSSLGGPSGVATYPELLRTVSDGLADALRDC